jgi:ABC-2 type transport system ATP-binding protein
MHFIETSNIVKRYSNHLALNKVSISVPKQSIFGLLGPNGAGKTSLIRIINQITAPDEGFILLDGKPFLPEHTQKIGYLPEERGLYKKMKVGEQALYLAQLKGVSKNEATIRLKKWFEKFEIESWWNRKVEELSKGMQQKIQFIVTVIHNPEILIFDEPFSGFDPINVNILKEEILRLRDEGSTILFSTHNMASVEELCDNIALINQSEKILDGRVDEIKRQYRSHTFELKMNDLKSPVRSFIPPDFDLLMEETNNFGETVIRIKSQTTADANKLISTLLPYATIVAFSEILPTMNEIFIEKVQASQNNSVKSA